MTRGKKLKKKEARKREGEKKSQDALNSEMERAGEKFSSIKAAFKNDELTEIRNIVNIQELVSSK